MKRVKIEQKDLERIISQMTEDKDPSSPKPYEVVTLVEYLAFDAHQSKHTSIPVSIC